MLAAVLAAAALASPQVPAAAAALASPQVPAAAAPPAPPQVLVVTETRGFVHDSIPAAKTMVGSLGYRTAFLKGANELTARRLAKAKAIVFLNTSGELHLDAAGKRRLLAFVRKGGGFVGTHSAADTFAKWPAFHRLVGADFLGHPPPGPGRVDIVDRAFTTTRSFTITEEFYAFKGRAKRHVIARQHDGAPLVWSRHYGRGRVFYDALGHFPATWSDAHQRALVADGLRWAIGSSARR
jgi:type 1 glutamine amidotransferase